MNFKVSMEISEEKSVDVYEDYVDIWILRNGKAKFETIRFDAAFRILEDRHSADAAKAIEKTPAVNG